jgi:hypothetical protein
MKGHVGGGPGHRGVQGLEGSVKLSRSIEFMRQGFSPGEWLYMSQYISTVICNVQERLLEVGPGCRAVRRAAPVVGRQLESLILAQNERWRHA